MRDSLLVTGASSDVGIALLRKVGPEYGTVCLQYRNMNDGLQELMGDLGKKTELIPIRADFSDPDAAGMLVGKLGDFGISPLHVVHLPAPRAHQSNFHKDEWSFWDEGWEVCVHSIVTMLKAFLPGMARARHGRIVFMLTSYTVGDPPRFLSSYVTVKYALLGLMKSLAAEYAGKGITVNGVSPNMMETKFLSELPHLVIEQNAEKSPLGRNVLIEEVIPVFQYILSDAGAAMTGENVAVRGGM